MPEKDTYRRFEIHIGTDKAWSPRLARLQVISTQFRIEVYTGRLSPWLTGRTGWKKSLESGYGYGHGYKFLLGIYFYANC